ncbi:MAG: phospholipase D-like domain-containing protein [Myxococcaceae bacterium]
MTQPMSGDESVELLSGGEALFPRMLVAINGAQQSVHLEIYTLALDKVGQTFVAALRRAAERQVKVRVILDGWGSVEDGAEIAAQLRASGCTVSIFNPFSAWLRGKLLRNHRKILVVDDEISFVGGINIAQPYATVGNRLGWADLALEVHGPATRELAERLRQRGAKRMFAPRPKGALRELHPQSPPQSKRSAAPIDSIDSTERHVRIHLSGLGGGKKLRDLYGRAIKHARQRAYLAHAYFLPDAAFIRALARAARRGVQVTLLLAGRSDVPFARAATMRLYQQLLKAGVKIFEWDQSVLHAKAAAIDGELLLVGSFNLDPLSLVNLECLVEVRSHSAVISGERWIESRTAFSREVTLASCARTPVQSWLTDIIGLWAARLAQWWAQVSLGRRKRQWD